MIVFATEKPTDVPRSRRCRLHKLDAVAGNRAVYTDGTLAGALYFLTPLSLEYALENLPSQLAAAVAGEAPQKVVDTSAGPSAARTWRPSPRGRSRSAPRSPRPAP